MANAIQCDICKKCYAPDKSVDRDGCYPVLRGTMVDYYKTVHQKKEWDLCYDCFNKINTFIGDLEIEATSVKEES